MNKQDYEGGIILYPIESDAKITGFNFRPVKKDGEDHIWGCERDEAEFWPVNFRDDNGKDYVLADCEKEQTAYHLAQVLTQAAEQYTRAGRQHVIPVTTEINDELFHTTDYFEKYVVQPMTDANKSTPGDGTNFTVCTEKEAEVWSVMGVFPGGGSAIVLADCETKRHAESICNLLMKASRQAVFPENLDELLRITYYALCELPNTKLYREGLLDKDSPLNRLIKKYKETYSIANAIQGLLK